MLGAVGAAGRELRIVDQGRSNFHIVAPPHPAPAEAFAVEEFQRYIEKISGIRLPTGASARLPAVLIGGAQEAIRRLLDGRKSDSYVILETGGNLYLAGNTPAGTLYAV